MAETTIVGTDGLIVPAEHPDTGKDLTPEARAILVDAQRELAELRITQLTWSEYMAAREDVIARASDRMKQAVIGG